jgi:hypothetical protein
MCLASPRKIGLGALIGMIAGGFFVCKMTLASHIEPEKAKKYIVEMVTTYEPCLAPNDYTASLPIPACSPVVRSDSLCGFEEDSGSGKFVGKVVRPGDIKLRGVIRGLSAACEGWTFAAVVAVRITTEDCVEGDSCTTGDFEMPIGTCKVTGGRCDISSSVNALLPGALRPGDNEGFEVLGCGLVRINGPDAPVQTLSCGLLIK